MKVTITWGDGEHDFELGLGEIRELQQKTKVGPYRLFQRILSGDWEVDDLRETLRLGLIGGGMANAAAATLIKNNFDGRPMLQHVEPAIRVLGSFLAPEEPDKSAGKPPAPLDNISPMKATG